MQAINHIATALILKRAVPSAPLFGLMVATETVEFVWVGLNFLGVERIEVTPPGTSVTDVHLAHMPFSHSIATNLFLSVLVGLAVFASRRGKPSALPVAFAMALALLSHIVLDLLTHAPDIPLAPFIDVVKYGSGLGSNWPLTGLLIETAFGLCCWWIYGGSRALFGVFLLSAAIALPSYLPPEWAPGVSFSIETFPVVIGLQICLTLGLVWLFARR